MIAAYNHASLLSASPGNAHGYFDSVVATPAWVAFGAGRAAARHIVGCCRRQGARRPFATWPTPVESELSEAHRKLFARR